MTFVSQPWVFFGWNDAKAETPILWPPHAKSWFIGKDSDAERDWGQEEKGITEDEMVGWHHQLSGRGFRWTPGVGDRQGGLACCSSWVTKNRTWLSDWTELNWKSREVLFSKVLSRFLGFRKQWYVLCNKVSYFLLDIMLNALHTFSSSVPQISLH